MGHPRHFKWPERLRISPIPDIPLLCIRLRGGPFIETDAADVYRQVALVAQPGSQEAFLAAPEREVLLAGPRGTGKTLTLLTDFFAEIGAAWGANWKGVLIRQSMTGFPEIKSLCSKVIPRIWPNARFNQNQNVWTWPTGETLKLAYFDETSDYRTYIGQSFTWIGFEELTQYKNDQPYKQMLACLRSAVPNIPMRVRATTNPDGPGHNWVRRRFKTIDPNGTIVGPRIEDEHGLLRRAIYSTLAGNQLLLATQPDYLANIVASAIRPGQLEAWTRGSWTISSGGMFDGDWPEASKHCVLPPIPARSSRRRGASRPPSTGAIRNPSPGFGRRSAMARRSSCLAVACCGSSAAIPSSSTNSTAVIRTNRTPACAGPSIRSNALAFKEKSIADCAIRIR